MTPHSLRRRLARTVAATGVISALLVGLIFWLSEETIEQESLQRLMQSELRLLSGRAGANTQHQLYFRAAAGRPPPPEWQSFQIGSFQRVDYAGRPYQLLVGEGPAGDRVYLAQSLSLGEQRESWLFAALALGVLASALLALAVSGRLSRLALQPLNALLERVRSLRPDQRGQRLQAAPDIPELDTLIQALNDYMRALDQLVRHEQVFTSAAAHELHTPLTVISGAAELLAARYPQDPAVGRIQRAGQEAQQALDLLLALSHTRELPPARDHRLALDLPRLAQQCAPPPGISLHWQADEHAILYAPTAAISLIFLNLLKNALRAARHEVRVEVSAGLIAVIDDGPGIAPELLAQVFEPGVTGGGGSGLGLYIAHSVASRMGWILSLHNRAQGGVRAKFRWDDKIPA